MTFAYYNGENYYKWQKSDKIFLKRIKKVTQNHAKRIFIIEEIE